MRRGRGAGFVNGWVDFNAGGDWDDPGEQVFTDVAVMSGTNMLTITVPAGATLGSTFARFRLTATAGYSYFGLAPNGEVEDYQMTVAAPPPPESTDSIADSSSAADPESPLLWWTIPQHSEGFIMSSARPFSFLSHPFSLLSTEERSRFNGR